MKNWLKRRWAEPSTKLGIIALAGLIGTAFGIPPEATESLFTTIGGVVAAVATVVQIVRKERE